MAGINQHIIPDFLQRGFSHRQNKKGTEFYTFLYRKDDGKYEANTKGAGAERYFYTESASLNADPEITDLETKVYSPLVTELRAKTGLEEINESRIPEFIAHLFARNKRLREIVRENGGFIVKEIKDYLSDSENVKKLILSDPSVLQKEIEKKFNELGLAKSQRVVIREKVRHLLPQLIEEQTGLMRDQFVSEIDVALVNLPMLVKESHIQSLLNKPFPAARADNYSGLKWFVVTTSDILILGDFCVLFELVSEERFGVFHGGDDQLINVFLPISSRQMLVGTTSDNVPNINVELINLETAKRCLEHFICSVDAPKFVELHTIIGTEAKIVSPEQLGQIIGQLKQSVEDGTLSKNN